jgi:hypothetical protein
MGPLIKLSRLVVLTLTCACFGYVLFGGIFLARDSYVETRRMEILGAVLGAFCGIASELWVRGWRPSRRIGVWGLLELTAIIAVAIAAFALIGDA